MVVLCSTNQKFNTMTVLYNTYKFFSHSKRKFTYSFNGFILWFFVCLAFVFLIQSFGIFQLDSIYHRVFLIRLFILHLMYAHPSLSHCVFIVFWLSLGNSCLAFINCLFSHLSFSLFLNADCRTASLGSLFLNADCRSAALGITAPSPRQGGCTSMGSPLLKERGDEIMVTVWC